MRRNKVTVVGAGNVGATCAHWIASKELADVVLVDIVEGMPQGKGLDLMQSGPVEGFDLRITGTNGYEETKGSDVVVITSGIARKPGMSRDDLIATNKKIVGEVSAQVAKSSPDAIVIVVSNPLDAMCHVASHVTKFPRERVIGMAGVLDPRAAGLVVTIDEYLRRGHADSVGMKVRFAWKPDALYFAVESSDDEFRTDNGSRQQDDAAVFYLNLDADTDGAPDTSDYALVLRARGANDDHELINLGDPLLDLTGVDSASRTSGESFSIEARVPTGVTGVTPAPIAFASIGLSVLRIDDDHLNNPGGNNADAEALYFWFVGPSTCETCCPGFDAGKERPSCDTTVMTTTIYDQPL